jgi:hypothetical protein
MARAEAVALQKVTRHTDLRLTTETYGVRAMHVRRAMKAERPLRRVRLGGLALAALACGCPSGSSTPASHAIRGHIAQTGGATVVIALSGASASTTSTDAAGNYGFTGLADGAYELTPTQAGNSFSPATRSVSVAGADVLAQDFTGTLTACLADSSQALLRCAAAVQARTCDTIQVQGGVVCTGADACRVRITDVPVTIRGAPGSFIHRTDHHDYPLFQFLNNPTLTLQDLTIDEDEGVACFPLVGNPPAEDPRCGRTIDVWNAGSTMLDHVTIGWSKSVATNLNTGGDAHVVHSRFIGAHLFGLSVNQLTGSMVVEDSAFSQISSNALVLYDVHGTSAAPARISRTLFERNHRDDVYFVCGPSGTEQCSGGQVLLYGSLDFLRVEDSVIRLGGEIGPPAGGVEVNPTSLHDISFVHDDVHSHGQWGVGMNPNPVDVARFSFSDNELYDNGTAPDYNGVDIGNFPPGIVTETNSCHSAGCNPVPIGVLWALPGGSFSWATNDLTAPNVMLDGAPLSAAANGQGTADAGSVVVLFDGTLELDRVLTR